MNHYIVQLETKNGRVFKVAIMNKTQQKRLDKIIAENKKKSEYEQFVKIETITKQVHSINEFEELCKTLQ